MGVQAYFLPISHFHSHFRSHWPKTCFPGENIGKFHFPFYTFSLSWNKLSLSVYKFMSDLPLERERRIIRNVFCPSQTETEMIMMSICELPMFDYRPLRCFCYSYWNRNTDYKVEINIMSGNTYSRLPITQSSLTRTKIDFPCISVAHLL